MDSQTKLTPEQVAGFEARAAAGERPVLEWYNSTDSSLTLDLVAFDAEAVIANGSGCTKYPPDRENNPRLRYHLPLVSGPELKSHVAAQLAAEHLLAEATLPIHASALASRDGEIAALRAELERAVTEAERQNRSLRVDVSVMRDYERGDVWLWDSEDDNDVESLSCPVLISAEDIRGLVARAEAAEARANIAETDFWRLKNEAAAECSRLTDRVAALEAALGECRTKMEATKYSAPESPSLSSEAKLEQGTFNAAVDGCLSILDAARAGGQG